MDQADRERFLETLRSDDAFRATVRREVLTEELLGLPLTVAEMQRQFAQMQRDMAQMQHDLAELLEELRSVRADMRTLVEMMHRSLEVTLRGFENLGNEIAEHKRDTAAGFATVGARLDQVEAAIADLGRGSGGR